MEPAFRNRPVAICHVVTDALRSTQPPLPLCHVRYKLTANFAVESSTWQIRTWITDSMQRIAEWHGVLPIFATFATRTWCGPWQFQVAFWVFDSIYSYDVYPSYIWTFSTIWFMHKSLHAWSLLWARLLSSSDAVSGFKFYLGAE
jgi:hypothetical protein